MADPLSITASILAVITATTTISVRSPNDPVKHSTDRDKILQRLRHELEYLVKILDSLSLGIDAGDNMLEILHESRSERSDILP